MKTRISIVILFTILLSLSSAPAALLVYSWSWRQFAWQNDDGTGIEWISSYEPDVTDSSVPLSGTKYGITFYSSAFTDSGFNITASASNPTPGKQWSEYIYTEFSVDVPTAFTLSGNLYSPNPMSPAGGGFDQQYVNLIAFDGPPSGSSIYSLEGTNYNVVGPQAYSVSGILQPNILYSIDSTSAWTTPTDGFNGNFMTLTLGSPAAVPEPGQVAASILLLAGIGGYVFLKRRKTTKVVSAPVAA